MTPDEYITCLKEIDILKNSPSIDKNILKDLIAKIEIYESKIYPLARILSGI